MTKFMLCAASIGLAAVLSVPAATPSFAQGYGYGYGGGWRGQRVVVAPRYGYGYGGWRARRFAVAPRYGYGYYAPAYGAYAFAPDYSYPYPPVRRWPNENDAVSHGWGPIGSYGNPLGCVNGNTGQPGVLDTGTC